MAHSARPKSTIKVSQGCRNLGFGQHMRYEVIAREILIAELLENPKFTTQQGLSCIYHMIPLSVKVVKSYFVTNDDGVPVVRHSSNEQDIAAIALSDDKSLWEGGEFIMLSIAFGGVTGLVKEITEANKAYVFKSLKRLAVSTSRTAWISFAEKDFDRIFSFPSFAVLRMGLLTGANRDLLADALHRASTVGDAGEKESLEDTVLNALRRQFRLVLEGHGMMWIKEIRMFFKRPNYAMICPVVLQEMLAFNAAYRRLVKEAGEELELAAVLKMPALADLTIRKFPHLYTCSVVKASKDASASTSRRNMILTNVDSDLLVDKTTLMREAGENL